jgi:hypothetical protein
MPLTPEENYELGYKLGLLIRALFEVIAALDGKEYREAVDDWVSAYVAERIIEGD